LHANVKLTKPFVVTGRYAAKLADEQSNGVASKTFTQMVGGRVTYDFAKRWDFSVHGALLASRGLKSKQYVYGAELGYLFTDNLWLSAGYNWSGYSDPDLAFGEYTARGAYVRLRYKFDETTLTDAPVIGAALGASRAQSNNEVRK
jgi:large repetitive protein